MAGRLGFQKLVFPVSEDMILEQNVEGTLGWLNSSYEKDHKEVIQKALGKSKFQLRKDESGRRHPLEDLIS